VLVFLQLVENEAHMAEVLRPRRAEDEDVIEKNQYEPPEEGLQHIIHQGLKCRRCVRQLEGHEQELEQPLVGAEGCHLDVVRVHVHLVITQTEVELGEEDDAAEFVEQLFDDRYQKLVLDGALVQGPVVDIEPPRLVLLLDEED
jgi:hypothetical protein